MSILSSSSQGPVIRHHNFTSDINDPQNQNNQQETTSLFGEDGFTFGDVLDVLNPLQHIPIIGSIYRKITGDTIAPAMQIAGGALFSGPIGAIASVITTTIQVGFNNKSNNEADSPYNPPGTTTVNAEAIANQSTHSPDMSINNVDYSGNTSSTQQNIEYRQQVQMLKNKHVYRTENEIMNPVHARKVYNDVISATDQPKHNVDITIGSHFGIS